MAGVLYSCQADTASEFLLADWTGRLDDGENQRSTIILRNAGMAIGAEHTQMSNHEDWSLRGGKSRRISPSRSNQTVYQPGIFSISLQSSVVACRPIRKNSSQGRQGVGG